MPYIPLLVTAMHLPSFVGLPSLSSDRIFTPAALETRTVVGIIPFSVNDGVTSLAKGALNAVVLNTTRSDREREKSSMH